MNSRPNGDEDSGSCYHERFEICVNKVIVEKISFDSVVMIICIKR